MTLLACPHCRTLLNLSEAQSGEDILCEGCMQGLAFVTDYGPPKLVALGPDSRLAWEKPELREGT
jgi:uncharacterized protein YbaR (Trm112 family)